MTEEEKGEGRGADESKRPVVTTQAVLGARRARKWVEILPGQWGCVWEPTVAEMAYANDRAWRAGQFSQLDFRLELFVSCLKCADTEKAEPLFQRTEHWEQLQEISHRIVEDVVRTALVLAGPITEEQTEAMRDFFGPKKAAGGEPQSPSA